VISNELWDYLHFNEREQDEKNETQYDVLVDGAGSFRLLFLKNYRGSHALVLVDVSQT